MLGSHAGDPGSNPTKTIDCLIFWLNFSKVALLDRAKSCDFLKSPSQELSEYMVLANGTQKFANLDFREVWPSLHFNPSLVRPFESESET